MVLVGDIGGTNTTLALVRDENGTFTLVESKRYASSELNDLNEALDDFIREFPEAGNPRLCCISAAGPVLGNVCRMTNVHWSIDGDDLSRTIGCPTYVINDFSAICYALPLIETHDAINAVAFEHPDGSTPAPRGAVSAVVGAGTGLGTGFLTEDAGHYVAHPSEGGHGDFAPVDSEMTGLVAFLRERYAVPPGVEQYVSGQGIANAFEYALTSGLLPSDPEVDSIASLDRSRKPVAVAEAADDHEGLALVMRLFVRMYARYASNIALTLMPSAGLYLAGGIASKNQRWFTDDHYFMTHFEMTYNPVIEPLLRQTPVQLITDYAISLYGAAHAAYCLSGSEWRPRR